MKLRTAYRIWLGIVLLPSNRHRERDVSEVHPERALIGLLLPGAVFCCLTFMDWWKSGRQPQIVLYGRRAPIPLIYVALLVSGWLLLILMLAQRIRRS